MPTGPSTRVRAGFGVLAAASTMALLVLGMAGTAAAAATTTRVSVNRTGTAGNGDSLDSAVSADGRFVAFTSDATNLVRGDANSERDVFVRDRRTGATERVSVSSSGVAADRGSHITTSAVSADGRFVVFESVAGNLVRGDTNHTSDVFVRDRLRGTTERVSVRSGGGQADQDSFNGSISADGRFVVFSSAATNLVRGDTNGFMDVFVHDRRDNTTTRVSVGRGGVQGADDSISGAVSADGRFVMFQSHANNLVPGDTTDLDVFVRDLRTGRTERASVDSTGRQLPGGANGGGSISADGRLITFVSGDAVPQVYVHDRVTGNTRAVSVSNAGAIGDGPSGEPSISPDGRFVAFTSSAPNLGAGGDRGQQAFVRDLVATTTTQVSVGNGGESADGPALAPAAGNRGVTFASGAHNLGAGTTFDRVQVYFRSF